jgi:hypothetical protein
VAEYKGYCGMGTSTPSLWTGALRRRAVMSMRTPSEAPLVKKMASGFTDPLGAPSRCSMNAATSCRTWERRANALRHTSEGASESERERERELH